MMQYPVVRRNLAIGPVAAAIIAAVVISGASTRSAAAQSRPDLTGAIVASATGKPIAGATVSIYTAGPRTGVSPYCPSCWADCAKTATTGSNGRFRIASLSPALVFRVLVVGNGYSPTFDGNVDPFKGAIKVAMKRASLNISSPLVLHGRVVDESGNAVVGATISPQGVHFLTSIGPDGGGITGQFGGDLGVDPLAVTDSKGEFLLRTRGRIASVVAQISARGFATQTRNDLAPGPDGRNIVRMRVGTMVTGTVTDPSGRGISGATVEIVPVDRNSDTFTGWVNIATNSHGEFSLPGVVPDTPSVLCVCMDGLAPRSLGAPQRSVTTGHNGAITSVGRVIVAPAGTVHGRILLTDGRAVAPGTRIMLGRDDTWDVQIKFVSADGSFAFDGVPIGEHLTLTVGVAGYESDTGEMDANCAVDIPAGQTNQTLDVMMVPAKTTAKMASGA
jgi:protocatechuate 3,4-dioxygenase beta subunit